MSGLLNGRLSERTGRARTARTRLIFRRLFAVSVFWLAFGALGGCANPVTHNPAPSAAPVRPHVSSTPAIPRVLLPGHRIIAYYGAADTPSMGVLGTGSIAHVLPRLLAQAAAYRPYGEPVIPAFELIAVVAQRDPGRYGAYSMGVDDATIERYVRAAREMHGIVILDIQPGRASFLPLVKKYERFLRKPGVSLALDSEWSMGPAEVPGEVIGGTTAAAVNEVGAYLAHIVRADHLGQKLLIVHQFTPDMIADRPAIRRWPGVALVFHVDGFGDRPNKLSKYYMLAQNRRGAYLGLKLFYDQDVNMFSAREVMRLKPPPDLITYQ